MTPKSAQSPYEPVGWKEVLHCTDAFHKAMNRKLIINQHKGNRSGWLKDAPLALLERLKEETAELEQAIISKNGDVLGEAADVGNFAMMVADACGALTNISWPDSRRCEGRS
jgi:NTP pyrophosphatase (non-canonical NTP hydrolase)